MSIAIEQTADQTSSRRVTKSNDGVATTPGIEGPATVLPPSLVRDLPAETGEEVSHFGNCHDEPVLWRRGRRWLPRPGNAWNLIHPASFDRLGVVASLRPTSDNFHNNRFATKFRWNLPSAD